MHGFQPASKFEGKGFLRKCSLLAEVPTLPLWLGTSFGPVSTLIEVLDIFIWIGPISLTVFNCVHSQVNTGSTSRYVRPYQYEDQKSREEQSHLCLCYISRIQTGGKGRHTGIIKGEIYNGIPWISIAHSSAGLRVRPFGLFYLRINFCKRKHLVRLLGMWDRPIASPPPIYLHSRTQTQLKCGRTPTSRMEFSMRLIRNENSGCL